MQRLICMLCNIGSCAVLAMFTLTVEEFLQAINVAIHCDMFQFHFSFPQPIFAYEVEMITACWWISENKWQLYLLWFASILFCLHFFHQKINITFVWLCSRNSDFCSLCKWQIFHWRFGYTALWFERWLSVNVSVGIHKILQHLAYSINFEYVLWE